MTEKIIKVDKMGYDPCVMFTGTAADQQEAEQIERQRAQFFQDIINDNNFVAMQIEPATKHDSTRILHHNTRAGYDFQLSFIGCDMVPEMHENIYNRPGSIAAGNNMTYLINELVNLTLYHDRTIKLLYA